MWNHDAPEEQLKEMIVDFRDGERSENALYTLKDYDWEEDGKKYLSLRRIYVETEDPTGYKFSQVIGWKLFKKIWASPVFEKKIPLWEEELSLRLRSRGLENVLNKIDSSFQAAKWLADKGWIEDGRFKRARDSKKAEDRKLLPEIEEDVKRLGLSLVKGKK